MERLGGSTPQVELRVAPALNVAKARAEASPLSRPTLVAADSATPRRRSGRLFGVPTGRGRSDADIVGIEELAEVLTSRDLRNPDDAGAAGVGHHGHVAGTFRDVSGRAANGGGDGPQSTAGSRVPPGRSGRDHGQRTGEASFAARLVAALGSRNPLDYRRPRQTRRLPRSPSPSQSTSPVRTMAEVLARLTLCLFMALVSFVLVILYNLDLEGWFRPYDPLASQPSETARWLLCGGDDRVRGERPASRLGWSTPRDAVDRVGVRPVRRPAPG